MTTYRKAWLFNAVWIVIFATGLGIAAWQMVGTPESVIPALSGVSVEAVGAICIIAAFAFGFLGNSFPKCEVCDHPVNMPDASEPRHSSWLNPGSAIPFIRPMRPPKECGYCGNDLTTR